MNARMRNPRRNTASILSAMLCIAVSAAAVAEPVTITPPTDRVPAVWLGPRVLDPKEAGVGRQVPDLALGGIDGKSHSLHRAGGRYGTVVVVRDPECPVSRSYAPRISQLARHYTGSGFGFVFIYPNEALDDVQRHRDRATLSSPGIFVDKGGYAVAQTLGVRSTGDVFVLDREFRVRYRGAVDDQYGLGYTRDIPMHHYLRNALDAIGDGRDVPVPATAAPGCFIDADPAKDGLIERLPDGQMLSRIRPLSDVTG